MSFSQVFKYPDYIGINLIFWSTIMDIKNVDFSELSMTDLQQLLTIAKKTASDKKTALKAEKQALKAELEINGRYAIIDGNWKNIIADDDIFSIKYVQDNEFSGHYDVKNPEEAPEIIPVSHSKGKNSVIRRMGYQLVPDNTGITIGHYVKVKLA